MRYLIVIIALLVIMHKIWLNGLMKDTAQDIQVENTNKPIMHTLPLR